MYRKITDYLDKCVEQDLLSHAYIFYGPDETAKKIIASDFANKIIGSTSKFNPDLMSISTDANEELTINLIRQLKKFLSLSSCFGKYKVVIIEKAENLNIFAQNALLKTFEEAPKHAIIIICVKTIDLISETIASRGVKLPFWQENKKNLTVDSKILEAFDKMLDDNSKNQYQIIEQFNNYAAAEIFREWLEFLRSKFLSSQSKRLNNILRVSQDIYFKLNETNVNPKLSYDELIMNLWKS